MKKEIINLEQKGKYITSEVGAILNKAPKAILHKQTGAGLTYGILNDTKKSYLLVTTTRGQVESKYQQWIREGKKNPNAKFIFEDSEHRWKDVLSLLNYNESVTVMTTGANLSLVMGGNWSTSEKAKELYELLISRGVTLVVDEYQELFNRSYLSTIQNNVKGQTVFDNIMQAAEDFKSVLFASASGFAIRDTKPLSELPIYRLFQADYQKPFINIKSFTESRYLDARLFEEIEDCIAINNNENEKTSSKEKYDLLIFNDDTTFAAAQNLKEIAVACGQQMFDNIALRADVTPLLDSEGKKQKGFIAGAGRSVQVGSKSVIAGVDYESKKPVKVIIVSKLSKGGKSPHLLKDSLDVNQAIGRVRSGNFLCPPEVWEYHPEELEQSVVEAFENAEWEHTQTRNKDISRLAIVSNYVLHRRRSAESTQYIDGLFCVGSEIADTITLTHTTEERIFFTVKTGGGGEALFTSKREANAFSKKSGYPVVAIGTDILEAWRVATSNSKKELPELLVQLYNQRNAPQYTIQHDNILSRWDSLHPSYAIPLLIQAVVFELGYTSSDFIEEDTVDLTKLLSVVQEHIVALSGQDLQGQKFTNLDSSSIEEEQDFVKNCPPKELNNNEVTLNARKSGVEHILRTKQDFLKLSPEQKQYTKLVLLTLSIGAYQWRYRKETDNAVRKIMAGKDEKGSLQKFMEENDIKNKKEAEKLLAAQLKRDWEEGLKDFGRMVVGLFADLNIKEGREYHRFASLNRELRKVLPLPNVVEIDVDRMIPTALKALLIQEGFKPSQLGWLTENDIYKTHASKREIKKLSRVSKAEREKSKKAINSVINWHNEMQPFKLPNNKTQPYTPEAHIKALKSRLNVSDKAAKHLVKKYNGKGVLAKKLSGIEERIIQKVQKLFTCGTVRLHDGLYLLPIKGGFDGLSIQDIQAVELGGTLFSFSCSVEWERLSELFQFEESGTSIMDEEDKAQAELGIVQTEVVEAIEEPQQAEITFTEQPTLKERINAVKTVKEAWKVWREARDTKSPLLALATTKLNELEHPRNGPQEWIKNFTRPWDGGFKGFLSTDY